MTLTHGVLGFAFSLSSEKYSPAYIEQRIEAFVESFEKVLAVRSQFLWSGNANVDGECIVVFTIRLVHYVMLLGVVYGWCWLFCVSFRSLPDSVNYMHNLLLEGPFQPFMNSFDIKSWSMHDAPHEVSWCLGFYDVLHQSLNLGKQLH